MGLSRWPQYLPKAKASFYSTWDWAQYSGEVVLIRADSGRPDTLLQDAVSASYAADHLWFIRQGDLYAAPFDDESARIIGDPHLIRSDIRGTYRGQYVYSVADNGTLVYASSDDELVGAFWVDREGHESVIGLRGIKPDLGLSWPAISHDGTRVAFLKRTSVDWTMWIYDFNSDQEFQFTFGSDGIIGDFPIWSPDDQYIYYTNAISGVRNTYRRRSDATRRPESFVKLGWFLGSFSPDNEKVVYDRSNDIRIFTFSDSTDTVFIDGGSARLTSPSFSPDGKWIVYLSNESGIYEVYVTDFLTGELKQRVSVNGGTEPLWSPTGRELFYKEGQRMMAVRYTSEPSFTPAPPEILFEDSFYFFPFTWTNYSVDLSGERFFVLKRIGGDTVQTIHVVQNALAN